MAVQEKHEIIVGLQLGETYAMLTTYTAGMKEPQSLQLHGPEDGNTEDRYALPMPEEVWKAARGLGQPIEKLRDYLDSILTKVCTAGQRGELRICVTVPRLDRLLGERLPKAFELLGIVRRHIWLQDYLTSFYYYAVNQRRDLWNTDVALLEYHHESMVGYILHIDRAKSPALVTVRQAARQPVGKRERDGRSDRDWDRERDRLFFEMLKKVFDGRIVQTAYLVGTYYDRTWAERSFQYLCGGRHAFQGMNLYTKGACYAAMERRGLLRMNDMLFVGEDIVTDNLGMEMRIRGKSGYYPLVTAGVNWYEAHHECEFISDDETQITIVSKPMNGGEEVTHILPLDHFPNRPKRMTRLRMLLYFTDADTCVVEVEDLGFGGLQRSTHRIWKRNIYFRKE